MSSRVECSSMEQQLGNLFEGFVIKKEPVSQFKTYRAEMIEKFMEFLREPYRAYKGVELNARLVAIKFNKAKVADWELKPFLEECLSKKNPSVHFWSSFTEAHWERRRAFIKKFYNT
jgi:hypothetical protein